MHGRFAPDPRTLVVGEARESHAHVAGAAASTGLLCNPGDDPSWHSLPAGTCRDAGDRPGNPALFLLCAEHTVALLFDPESIGRAHVGEPTRIRFAAAARYTSPTVCRGDRDEAGN